MNSLWADLYVHAQPHWICWESAWADRPEFLIAVQEYRLQGAPRVIESWPKVLCQIILFQWTSRLRFKVESVFLPPLLSGFLAWLWVGERRNCLFLNKMLEMHLIKIILCHFLFKVRSVMNIRPSFFRRQMRMLFSRSSLRSAKAQRCTGDAVTTACVHSFIHRLCETCTLLGLLILLFKK